jgi:DNA-directed RNA polymerase I, II, and III subunit RPABC2
MYEEDDAQDEYYDPEVLADDDDAEGRADDDDNVVMSGDAAAAAAAAAQRKRQPKDLKVPDAERKTTPYMTKYERARILGTRAMQIRWVGEGGGITLEGLDARG